jgi:hypothetical protein
VSQRGERTDAMAPSGVDRARQGSAVRGVGLAREAALLGAECLVAESAGAVRAADEGWTAQPAARAALRTRMRDHETSPDPDRLRLCDRLGLDAHSYWLVMLCAAVELHPEAAAAVSLVAEDPRQQLPPRSTAAPPGRRASSRWSRRSPASRTRSSPCGSRCRRWWR